MSSVPHFFLSKAERDQPKCCPVAFHLPRDGRIYFGVGTFKEGFKQLRDNPQVEICACNGEDFLHCYGRAVFEQDDALADAVLDKLPAVRKLYNETTGLKLGVFHIGEANTEF